MTISDRPAPVRVESDASRRPDRRRRRPAAAGAARYLALAIMVVVLAGPLVWQLSLSFKGPGDDLFARPPQLLPSDPTLDNFSTVLERVPVLQYVANSAVVAAMAIVGNVVGATLAGYALARLRFRGRGVALGVVVAALLVPVETVIISQFLIVRSMQLTDTLLGVVLPTVIAALNVLLMRNAFAGLPDELEQAARVDGANAWQRFISISVPQVKGVITVVAIFAFVGTWNDFLWPLIVLSTESNFTLTVGLNRLRGTFTDDPRLIAAGTIIALVPIVIFFAALQRFFFRGLESGGLKG
ncbi:carbohydrate ABC transporter permease [Microbacterium sp. VKM Ac-2923]|uniref:carbohydrate ABC transporter permease n=1 Tax=Microbacterium sp. VKM Ac-2923 TaxID=2929476 RepID=UPI001FB30F2D|nr:carbohydrate ABC transporter permease [Microbacterium sp. VKM Ac-2923]MCJ1708763.1 carbohydrate ABC transporter permease [Microbacterium sp. VKM Ac-2923]